MKLYSYLEKLGDRVLYFDTVKIDNEVIKTMVIIWVQDSVIFTTDPEDDSQWSPEIGEFLGQMTDEIESGYEEGAYIDEFVSTGTKSYGFNGNTKEILCEYNQIFLILFYF